MVAEGVEHLGAGQDVEANEHDVVSEQHECSEVVCDHALAKDIVTEVADVVDLGVLHDELVHRDRGDPEKGACQQHCDYAGYPAEN